jgi:hypothetical protein
VSRRLPNRPDFLRKRLSILASRFRFFSAEDPVIAELRVLDVNSLSPLAALNKLYELQQRARE